MIDLPCRLNATTPPADFSSTYTGPQPETFTLLRKIYGGPQCWSQVYEAHISSWKGPATGADLGATFALKLYVLSELTRTEDGDWGVTSPVSNLEGAQSEMVRREKEAYQKLVGCPVTPRWYGTYQFELPGGEKCMGTVVEYLKGEPLSKQYGLSLDGEKLAIEYRMLAAAEAIDEIHSRGVSHGDIKVDNIIMVPGVGNCLQMMFVDFGAATTWNMRKAGKMAKKLARKDCARLYQILFSRLKPPLPVLQPLLRALPRKGPILKFLDVAGIKATYEEQLESTVKMLMSFGNSEEMARSRAALLTA